MMIKQENYEPTRGSEGPWVPLEHLCSRFTYPEIAFFLPVLFKQLFFFADLRRNKSF